MDSAPPVTRRDALKTIGVGVATIGLTALAGRAAAALAPITATAQPFALPKLGYAYAALEPHIDARTMEIHHTKHHQAYITNTVKPLADHPELQAKSGEELLRSLATLPADVRTVLRNNVGGHVNHAFFWRVIGPSGGGAPSGRIADDLTKTFGSIDGFKTQFAEAAMRRFGSGWAWLVVKNGSLAIDSTANQDSPLSEGATPVLGLDVWEHAYYLRYQNRRADYVTAFWNVVNWNQVAANYGAAK